MRIDYVSIPYLSGEQGITKTTLRDLYMYGRCYKHHIQVYSLPDAFALGIL